MCVLAICQGTRENDWSANLPQERLRAKCSKRTVPIFQYASLETGKRAEGGAIRLCIEIGAMLGKPVFVEVNGNVALGIGGVVLLKYWAPVRPCQPACGLVRYTNCVARRDWLLLRDVRQRETHVDESRFVRVGEVRALRRSPSAYRAASERSWWISLPLRPLRHSLGARLGLSSERYQFVESLKHVRRSAVDFRGPSVKVELPLRHRSILQRYRAAVCANSLLDPSGLTRSLQETSASIQEDTETARFFCA